MYSQLQIIKNTDIEIDIEKFSNKCKCKHYEFIHDNSGCKAIIRLHNYIIPIYCKCNKFEVVV